MKKSFTIPKILLMQNNKEILAMNQFEGQGEDYVLNIEFDSNTKKFKSSQNVMSNNERNLSNSLLDCILYPIKENYNDRNDKIFNKSIKGVLLLLVNNLFTLKISAFCELFQQLSNAAKISRRQETKFYTRTLISKLFDIINNRLQLCNYFFKSQNPLHYFYSVQTQKLIKQEIHSSVMDLVDQVQLKITHPEHHSIKQNSWDCLPIYEEEFNEKNEKCGTFGWCYVCRKTAYFYCKEERIPICSYECKLRNLDNKEQLQKILKNDKQNELKEVMFKQEYIKVFELLSDKCFGQEVEKEKTFFLEIMLDLIKTPCSALKRDPMFIIFIKKSVLPHLTITTFNHEHNVLKTSLIIFLNLVFNFRKYLRVEIGHYIRDVFLQILESVNSKYVFKYYVLQVLTTLIEEKNLPFELFLNYDCREDSYNICESIIDLLVKITQGKYSKNIYQTMINSEQEEKLRKEATEGIIHLIKGCSIYLNERSNKNTNETKEDLFASTMDIQHEGFKKVLEKKKQIDECFVKFNAGKKSAYRQLISFGILEEGPESLAKFLRNDKRVQPFIIGEIFGGEEEFNLKVLEIYLGFLDFKGISILEAMRYFLSLFEMPGEGQKVERILENFSKKYAEENSNLYTADGAYLLSFLLMMLHTNVYNPKVVEKMSLNDFLNIGKNIKNNEEQIDPEILTAFYHDIYQKPIAIHSLEKRKNEIQAILNNNERTKSELFKQETQKLVLKFSSKIKDFEIKADFQHIEDTSVLQIFIATIWSSLLAFFSTSIAQATDNDLLRSLIDSTMTMIKLSDIYNMQNERDSFINLLVQFSGLEKTFNKLLDSKNQLIIQAILQIAINMGNHLHTGWKFVLSCIVSLNYYLILAEKIDILDVQNQVLSNKQKNSLFITSFFTKDDLNKIFSDSNKLDEDSILDFFQGLIELSLKEIEVKGSRTHYILQQIVVVMNFNIDRNPLEWIRIWSLIDKFYEKIISKNSNDRSKFIIFSIDILRQLVMCCFRNPQLLVQKYQPNIFQVYITICSNKKVDGEIVDYLLISFQSLLLKLKDQIKGGISSIIATLNLCCSCAHALDSEDSKKSKEIQMEILNLLKFILDNLTVFGPHMIHDFGQILILLSSLCKKPFLSVIMKSLDLQDLIYPLFWNQQSIESHYPKSILDIFESIKNDDDKIFFHNENLYFQNFILKTLENLVEYPKEIINEEYKEITTKVFQISERIQDQLLMDSWNLLLQNVYQKLLKKLYQVFIANSQAVEDFKELFVHCAKQTLNMIFSNKIDPIFLLKQYFLFQREICQSENKTVLDCLTMNFSDLISIAASLDEENAWIKEFWEEIIHQLTYLFKAYYPNELTHNDLWIEVSNTQKPISLISLKGNIFQNKEFVAYKCKFVLNILKLIQIIIKKTELMTESHDQLFILLDNFIDQSQQFNALTTNRYVLWKKGYFSMKNSLPSLFIFEKNVQLAKFYDLQRMYKKGSKRIFSYLIQQFQNFKLRIQNLDEAIVLYHNPKQQIFRENEYDEEFKRKCLEEAQKNTQNLHSLLTDQIENFLIEIDWEKIDNNTTIDLLKIELIEFLPYVYIDNYCKMQGVNFNYWEGIKEQEKPSQYPKIIQKMFLMKIDNQFKQYYIKTQEILNLLYSHITVILLVKIYLLKFSETFFNSNLIVRRNQRWKIFQRILNIRIFIINNIPFEFLF